MGVRSFASVRSGGSALMIAGGALSGISAPALAAIHTQAAATNNSNWESANWGVNGVPNVAGADIRTAASGGYVLKFTGSATNSDFTVGRFQIQSGNNSHWQFTSDQTGGANANVLRLNNNGSAVEMTANNLAADTRYTFGSGLTLSLADNLTVRMGLSASIGRYDFNGPLVNSGAGRNLTIVASGRGGATTANITTTFANSVATGGTIAINDVSGQNGGTVVFSGIIGSSTAANNITGFTVNYSNSSGGSNGGRAIISGAAGSNLYTGATNVQRGMLSVRKDNGLGASGVGNGTAVTSTGILDFDMTGTYTNAESLSLAGSGPSTGAYSGAGALRFSNAGSFNFGGAVTQTAATTVNVSNSTGSFTLSGVYDDAAFGLTKIGAGTLVLSNASNTITGATQIKAGTLALTAASGNSNLGSSSIIVGTLPAESAAVLDVTNVAGGFQVKSGQTLAGHGSVLGNSVTINSGAILAPGNSIGTLTLNNALTLAGSSVLEISRSGAVFTNDKVVGIAGASPNLTYGGTLTVTNAGPDVSTSFVLGDSWDLFDGFTSYTGTFSSQSLPALNTGLNWSFEYATGVLTVVPEPASVASLAMLAAAAGMRRRR